MNFPVLDVPLLSERAKMLRNFALKIDEVPLRKCLDIIRAHAKKLQRIIGYEKGDCNNKTRTNLQTIWNQQTAKIKTIKILHVEIVYI